MEKYTSKFIETGGRFHFFFSILPVLSKSISADICDSSSKNINLYANFISSFNLSFHPYV